MRNPDRIAKLFSDCKENRRAAFVGSRVRMRPRLQHVSRISRSLIDNGVDLLELGVPFSDPLADGLTNQLAAQEALESGACQSGVFRLVEEIRKHSEVPIVFYTYYNLIFSQGIEQYVIRSREAGVDGLLTLDLPPEEATELVEASRNHGMKNVFIIAPTTPEERIPVIVEKASGFLYYVSREGVTGERKDLAGDLAERVETIRKFADLPVVVGFGISSASQVRSVGEMADGVVVGSALVNCISENLANPTSIPRAIGDRAAELVCGLSEG